MRPIVGECAHHQNDCNNSMFSMYFERVLSCLKTEAFGKRNQLRPCSVPSGCRKINWFMGKALELKAHTILISGGFWLLVESKHQD